MSNIVFFCIPAYGHTNPTLGVVRELVKRGHQVQYYSYDRFKDVIEETGAEFISCNAYDQGQNMSEKDGERLGKDLAFATQVLVNTTLALDPVVRSHMEMNRPDCIVGDSMAFWAKATAMKLKIPYISSTTTFAFNRYSAKYMGKSQGGLLSLLCSFLKIKKEIKKLQQAGYPVKNILDIISNSNDTETIVYTSKEFQPFAETFSDKYTFAGPSIRPVKEPFEKKKEKLIYISMGTVINEMPELYKKLIKALRETDAQIVISAGSRISPEELGTLPEHVSVYPFVDQMGVLEKADVFISHCGMNSVSESLYFGVPLLMIPQTNEQKAVAKRTEEVGAGILLKHEREEEILSAVNDLLQNAEYRKCAEHIGNGFKKCCGPSGAADKILGACVE